MKRPAGYAKAASDASDGIHSGMIKSSLTSPARNLAARWHGLRTTAAVVLLCAVVAGCGEQFQKGYILPPGALEQIPIGASQDQVLIVMGTPSTVATLNGEVFYYISQRSERPIAFMNDRIVDQRVIAIYFDKNRQVRRLANYGLKDGRIFDFISRTTPTSGQEINYIAPLFKALNIGQGQQQ
jgi:outer membrane protein assembly factor BamE (lipoprotein component of BamABCDE complex)